MIAALQTQAVELATAQAFVVDIKQQLNAISILSQYMLQLRRTERFTGRHQCNGFQQTGFTRAIAAVNKIHTGVKSQIQRLQIAHAADFKLPDRHRDFS